MCATSPPERQARSGRPEVEEGRRPEPGRGARPAPRPPPARRGLPPVAGIQPSTCRLVREDRQEQPLPGASRVVRRITERAGAHRGLPVTRRRGSARPWPDGLLAVDLERVVGAFELVGVGCARASCAGAVVVGGVRGPTRHQRIPPLLPDGGGRPRLRGVVDVAEEPAEVGRRARRRACVPGLEGRVVDASTQSVHFFMTRLWSSSSVRRRGRPRSSTCSRCTCR